MNRMDQQFDLIKLTTRMATPEDSHIPAYDHTKLSNINTCPTWGILRYSMHKKMPGSSRSMALEAGASAHEAFSAVRWYQFHRSVIDKTGAAIAENHVIKLFGADRFQQMKDKLSPNATDRTNCINFALEALYSCGFYDDIKDTKRTTSNISESIIAYINDYDFDRFPLWVRDPTDRDTDIGIEIGFNIVVTITYSMNNMQYTKQSRLTGRLDGLHTFTDTANKGKLLIIEEKTGSRLDDSWLSQWILSHQITGYCLASATFTGLPCNHALVSGMRIPIGRIPHEGIRKEMVPRNNHMFEKWANWFVTTVEIEEQWRDQVTKAPMYTHSCNRYFSSCSFLSFCAADEEEKEIILEEMETDEWNPLH